MVRCLSIAYSSVSGVLVVCFGFLQMRLPLYDSHFEAQNRHSGLSTQNYSLLQ